MNLLTKRIPASVSIVVILLELVVIAVIRG